MKHGMPSTMQRSMGGDDSRVGAYVNARRAIDERRSLVQLMEQQGEGTEDAHRLLGHLQHLLDDMIEFRDRCYGFEWDRLASRTTSEWDAWLNGRLRPLRW